MKHESIAKISAVVITLVLVALLLSQISIGDVAKTLTSIDPIYLIIGFIFREDVDSHERQKFT